MFLSFIITDAIIIIFSCMCYVFLNKDTRHYIIKYHEVNKKIRKLEHKLKTKWKKRLRTKWKNKTLN